MNESKQPGRLAKGLFASVLELSPHLRSGFLDRECAGDAALRDEVEDLLSVHRRAAGFMDVGGTAETEMFPALPSEQPGAMIGAYKLLQEIGSGGFGVVFMAEQTSPVRRRVALKLIRLGMDTKQVIARFEAERQALAVMNHPNIAKVFDAGATSEGRPYFVMELVAGDDITSYCERNRLSVRERLDLFLQVCRAVQHAHTKGIIHRDLKPSNVLVTTHEGEACAKVIDFGIAKATSRALTDKSFFTAHMAVIGTPAYCSPEQISGSPDIDTRTDVYALGVMLYELLSGATPFDLRELREKAWDEVCRTIKEDEPPAPSVRLSRILADVARVAMGRASEQENASNEPQALARGIDGEAKAGLKDPLAHARGSFRHRSGEANAIVRLLRGELDWITLKCLEKSPNRRYESASALAADVERHLKGEAVVAAPPSVGYRVRKYVRRHKTSVGVVCALAVGLVGMGVGMVMARRANVELTDAINALERSNQQVLEQTKQTRLAQADALYARCFPERDGGSYIDGNAFDYYVDDDANYWIDYLDNLKQIINTRDEILGPNDTKTIRAIFALACGMQGARVPGYLTLFRDAVARKEQSPAIDAELLHMWVTAAAVHAFHLEFQYADAIGHKLSMALQDAHLHDLGRNINGFRLWYDILTDDGYCPLHYYPDLRSYLVMFQPNTTSGAPELQLGENLRHNAARALAQTAEYGIYTWWHEGVYALECAERAVQADPLLPAGHAALAHACYYLEEYGAALESIREAIRLASAFDKPVPIWYETLHAMILWRLGDHDTARKFLEHACEQESGRGVAKWEFDVQFGFYYSKRRFAKDAEREFEIP